MHQFYKANTQKCQDTKSGTHIALLQMRSTPLGPVLPSPTMLLFNHPIRGIIPIINRPLIGLNSDSDHYEALVRRQAKNAKNHDTSRIYASIPIGSTVSVQHEDWGLWTHGTVER